jgi:hypothetical protein
MKVADSPTNSEASSYINVADIISPKLYRSAALATLDEVPFLTALLPAPGVSFLSSCGLNSY